MVVPKVLPPRVAASSIEDQLQYLYTRKQTLDRLIAALESYCQNTLPIPRKRAGSAASALILQSIAS